MSFEAKYAGRCPACEERIEVGDLLVWAEGEDGASVVNHADCVGIERPPAEVCTTCWLEKPCPCEDGL